MNKIDTSKVVPSLLKASTGAWTWDDGNHHLPYHWGTEALAWRTDKWESSYADLSYGDLWTPEMKGKVMGRPHSMMAGIGLYLDASGQIEPDAGHHGVRHRALPGCLRTDSLQPHSRRLQGQREHAA